MQCKKQPTIPENLDEVAICTSTAKTYEQISEYEPEISIVTSICPKYCCTQLSCSKKSCGEI